MAELPDVDTPMLSAADDESGSNSGSGSGSGSESEEEQVEWLATTREKRATAGNRLTSLIQQEGEDDELELLFAEDEDDAGFESAEDAGSDVQMDSSDDDDDQGPAAAVDDMEGEKELLRQAKAENKRKRRANDHIPKAFLNRKKVKIDPTVATTSTPPKPKKKVERGSWIPTSEGGPLRASMRDTTKQSKKQLHLQMVVREKKRLRQLESMKKAAARKEANAPKEVTQEDRLAEAARIEKRNAKSLNRWEEAERLREEEMQAKLAALHNRKMEGPVLTWWSGIAEWVGGKLKHVGKNVTIEEKEKAAPKKRKVEEIVDEVPKATELDSVVVEGTISASQMDRPAEEPEQKPAVAEKPADIPSLPEGTKDTSKDSDLPVAGQTAAEEIEDKPHEVTVSKVAATADEVSGEQSPDVKPLERNTSEETPKEISDLTKPTSPTVSTALGELPDAPTAPAISSAASPSEPAETASVAPPSVAPTPLIDDASPQPPVEPVVVVDPPQLDGSAPLPGFSAVQAQMLPARGLSPSPYAAQALGPMISSTDSTTLVPPQTIPTATAPVPAASTPSMPPPSLEGPVEGPPVIEHSTRNCMILEGFNDNAMRNKDAPMQVLFGRTFTKATKSKPPPPALCVITGRPAKYRDPPTGLPYADMVAYKSLQNVRKGDYVWSSLLQAYVGEMKGAKGVPSRFTAQPPPPSPGKS